MPLSAGMPVPEFEQQQQLQQLPLCHGALYMLVRDIVPCMGN